MIRINLLSGQRRLPNGLVNTVAVIGLLMVGFYWIKQIVVADFMFDEDPEIVYLEEPVVHLDALIKGQVAEVLPDSFKAQETSAATQNAVPIVEKEAIPAGPSRQDLKQASVVLEQKSDVQADKRGAREPAIGQPAVKDPAALLRTRPYRSNACWRVMEFSDRLPQTIRFTSMRSEMDGSFILEGISQGDIKILQDFSDSLSVTTEASFSYWSTGKGNKPPYNFIINGQLSVDGQAGLSTLSPASATILLERVRDRANESGLDSLYMEPPIRIPLAAKLVHHRSKILAQGSFSEIRAFIGALEEDKEVASLSDLVVSPVGPQYIDRPRLRLYTALDFVVGAKRGIKP